MKKSLALGLVVSCAGIASGAEVYRLLPNGSYERVALDTLLTVPQDPNFPLVNPVQNGQPGAVVTFDAGNPYNARIALAPASFGADGWDVQDTGFYTAVAVLPPAAGYVVIVDYNWSTFDSYGVAGAPSGYWDLFSVNLNQEEPYHTFVGGATTRDDPLVNPEPSGSVVFVTSDPADNTDLPGVSIAYGGLDYGEDSLETVVGAGVLELEGDPTLSYYLSFTIDTANTTQADGNYASWGWVNDPDYCLADYDGDGVLTELDITAYLADYSNGNLRANLTYPDAQINVNDLLMFLGIFRAGCGE